MRQTENRTGLVGPRGFTLVETLVVMVILSVVTMAAMSLIIPAKRSTAVQSDLSHVQGGMRFALDIISRDIRNAGFLVAIDDQRIEGNPENVQAGSAPDRASATADNPYIWQSEEIQIKIRSAIAGRMGYVPASGFMPSSADDQFRLTTPTQAKNFSSGQYVAFFNPLNGTIIDDDGNDAVDSNFYVSAVDSVTGVLTIKKSDTTTDPDKGALLPGADMPGYVLLRATDPTSTVKTIIYRRDAENNLFREVQGESTQAIAQGITGLSFIVSETQTGPHRVEVSLQGETIAASSNPNDPISSAKTRTMRVVVAPRNS
ncbi:MAG: prepilin-type N-terminal cleavage/methylation domain-containing protein [Desulfuromonadales bacterium]|nr:prepilin-type N-terminal cleavage/methylation domain-containing protein [Desulfuromonadales bacterium]